MIERYTAIEIVLGHVHPEDLVLTTTGMISREAFIADDRSGNFYMLGSMGLLSSFGLGLAILKVERRIFVLEGDGSALMSLGTLPLIGVQSPANLIHIILTTKPTSLPAANPLYPRVLIWSRSPGAVATGRCSNVMTRKG